MNVTMIVSAITIGVVFLYGCVGEILTEKSGHLNLGIPGIMCVGAAGGCYGAAEYMYTLTDNYGYVVTEPSVFMLILNTVLFAFLFAALVGLIYAFLTVSLRCNQNVTGLALTTFGAGLSQYLMDKVVKKEYLSDASKALQNIFPESLSASPVGQIFFSHGFLIYLAIIIALVAFLVLKYTKVGLNLRAVGENPAVADSAGINVTLYKYVAILVGSGIAGLGGVTYIMNNTLGAWQNSLTVQALGWLAIALVIFTLWNPALSILGSFIFGLLFIMSSYLNIPNNVKRIIELLPYFVTVVVLIVTSIIGKKETQPPNSLGLNYFREDR